MSEQNRATVAGRCLPVSRYFHEVESPTRAVHIGGPIQDLVAAISQLERSQCGLTRDSLELVTYTT